MKTQLITVPSFVFTYENEDGITEAPIQVNYYNGSIEFAQGNNSVLLDTNALKDFVKEITGHLPNATAWLEREQK